MKVLLMALSVLGMSAVAHADTNQKLVTVTKAVDNTQVEVGVRLDAAAALTGMYIIQADRTQRNFALADIAGKDGVVLNMTAGLKVLTLQGAFDARTQEGTFTMSYLTNAVNGNRGSCQFLLRKDATGFFIENFYTHQKPVTAIRVISTASGVTNLEGICPVPAAVR